MTIRDMYDYALIEMNKVEAPSLLLEDFNYFINKAVQQYINKVYNRYDINQQSSDDLRVLKATAELNLNKETSGTIANKSRFVYDTNLPDDYMHILNCIVEYEVKKPYKCYAAGDHVDFPARRLTADMAAGILHNFYMKPDYKRPYYYINNINLTNYDGDLTIPTKASTSAIEDPRRKNSEITEDSYEHRSRTDSAKEEDTRLSNASKVRLELRFGTDDTVFKPVKLYVDYIKSPMFIRLTYDDITSTEDKTRTLEFPDYVCYEIVNELVKLLMENASDPRVQTNYAVNQTIANPLAAQSGDQS